MHAEIKRFMSNSIIYCIGNILNRVGIFLLLPVYTNYLTPEEYGVLELVFVTVAFMRVFFGMRLGQATLRFFFEYEGEEEKKKLISSSMLLVILWSLFLIVILFLLSRHISWLLFKKDGFTDILLLGFAIMFFEVTVEIPLAFLRAKEYSILYVITSFLQLLLRVCLNIYMIIALHKGVSGILTGNLISAIIYWCCLCGIALRYSGVRFDYVKVKELWRYSYPLVISSLPGFILKNADRMFLSWYVSLSSVGLYALADRFGLVLRNFVFESFQLNYGPFRFSIMKQENAKEIYSRMFTYFLFVVTFLGLLIALYSREVIELMASGSFREAYKIVPLIIATTITSGSSYIIQTGLLIEKKTNYMPYISLITAILNVATLFLLVPPLGIYGASLSVLITNLGELVLIYRFSQNLYRITFESQRIVKIIGVAIFLYLISMLSDKSGILPRIFLKTVLGITFPFLLVPLKFYRADEIEKLIMLREKISIRVLSAAGLRRR